ncbi:related to E.coli tetracycline resistance protein TCR1 [Serendipita indica DSM 11827]|uniref:Related to E.coli tetracycline resistance protein TCR1 n=1 Tax=Serendipita indica (strain DSM 11827) TaxID=1109443 RepID=G4U2W6_SERID|nr:related to E.coli tetracycline resistance protein TCR1 [Serendipita indica DSM 11827]
MSGRNAKTGPGHIPLPPSGWNEDSALLTDTPSSHSRDPSPFPQPVFSPPQWNQQDSIPNMYTGDEPPEIPDKVPIPVALPMSSAAGVTPLPLLPMTVLSIMMLGEFLSANVSSPWVLFMVQSFHISDDDAEVGYWTGVLCSMFFITQFATSLLWATVAEKHGRRTVLIVSLLGMAITCTLFGTSRSYSEAIVIRLLQGVFGGAVGVGRGSVASVTDLTNEGRAYAIMGFAWGLGGVAGAIVGGLFESPAKNWPQFFGHVQLFIDYPYLLPCAVASSVTLLGAFLALFLGYDGGPREGAIKLSPDKENLPLPLSTVEEEEPITPPPAAPAGIVANLKHKVSRRFSDALARRVFDGPSASPRSGVALLSPLTPANQPQPKPRTMSRTSKVNGSAYGYSGRRGSRVDSTNRRPSFVSTLRRRRFTNTAEDRPGTPASFAQRLLLANEMNATSLADLWVQAAINVDNEEVFETDSESAMSDIEEGPSRLPVASTSLDSDETARGRHRPSMASTSSRPFGGLHRLGLTALTPARRPSSGSMVPAIFSHTGVRTPPNITAVSTPGHHTPEPMQLETTTLSPIAESRPISQLVEEKLPSTWSMLPMLIILQYGLLALHTTTHDQVFYLYLVSNYKTGGLELTPGHFAQLIAMMCLVQIVYQFYLYPNIGPPRGRFSHLAMFRIGSFLFIPAYLTVVLYRNFASPGPGNNFLVMSSLAVSTAIRYCGTTFAYTSVSILLNYMTPPPIVGLANGLAQSIVSLARFFGPIIGGYLWSSSVQDGPSGYGFGFSFAPRCA